MLEQLCELLAGVEESRAHRADRKAERIGDLLVREPEHLSQDQYAPVIFPKTGQGGLEIELGGDGGGLIASGRARVGTKANKTQWVRLNEAAMEAVT